MFTKLTAVATATLTAFALTAAAPAQANVFENHRELLSAIESVGVSTYINPSQVCDGTINGAYISSARALVVCQDNSTPDGPEVQWTANDLDTLRHEAQHLIQDCVDGGVGDNALAPLFDTDDQLIEYINNSSLTAEQIQRIIDVYTERGADAHVLRLELEAFVTATDISADRIATVLTTVCSAN